MCTAGWKITFFFSFMYIIILIGEIVPCENIVHNNNNNNHLQDLNRKQISKLKAIASAVPCNGNAVFLPPGCRFVFVFVCLPCFV